MSRKTILYIAISLDGYIAKPGDDLSFLSIVEKEGEDYGYKEFMNSVDTVIIGRKTYEYVMKHVQVFPHAKKKAFIITHQSIPNAGTTFFYNGNLKGLIEQQKSLDGKNIFIEGGSEIVHELLQSSLIDEFIISIIPILVGNGIRLFKDDRPEQLLEFISVKTFDSGLIQLHYKCTPGF